MVETVRKPSSNRSAKERRNTLFRVLDGVLSTAHKKIHAGGNSDRAKQGWARVMVSRLNLWRLAQGRGVGAEGDCVGGEAEEQHTDSESRGEEEMNGLSRKLHALEDNLLEFPPDDEGILMFIGDADEQTLHDKAEKIRETLRPKAKAIINDTTLTLEEQEQASKALLAELDDYQKTVLEQSSKFIDYRLRQLVCKYFEAAYPEERDTRVQLRVLWFFEEMQKFNELNKLEDWAFEHNRNEEAPGFDDFKWWEDMEAEKLRRYPEGNFSPESYEKLEDEYDIHMAQKIREYWEQHPKEFEELKKRSERQKRV
jgi:hypothetical protein